MILLFLKSGTKSTSRGLGDVPALTFWKGRSDRGHQPRNACRDKGRGGRDPDNPTYMEDTWLSQSHVGTHIHGISYIGRGDCY